MPTFDHGLEIEAAFYAAFEDGDIDRMMGLWLPAGKVLCIHPMGPELADLGAIRASWIEIFNAPFQRRIEIDVTYETGTEDLLVRTVKEIFTIPGQPLRSSPVAATNVFQRFDGRWYISVHHASPGISVESEQGVSRSAPTPITRH